ncbi:MAG: TolC family protein, partial [Sphaerospermopsis kisseleviana]
MKRQQLLFHSFLPGVTAAVLTTQSAWAGTVKVDEVKLVSSPSVLAATDVKTSVVDINRQLPITAVDNSPAFLPNLDFSQLSFPATVNQSVTEITAANNTNVPAVKSLKTVLPVSVTKVSQLTALNKCLQAEPNSRAALLLSSISCLQKNVDKDSQKVAQVNVPTESGTPNTQLPAQNTQNVTPTPTSSTETTLENLSPSSNPLLFPTNPEEVKLQETQPITLEQALELAKRNNNELQVAVLQLENSKGALREAQAALLPTVSLSGNVTNSRSTASTLSAKQAQRLNPEAPDAESNTAFDSQAQLRYDLYTSGSRNAAIKQAEEQVRFQELDVERQSEEIRLSVATDYYSLQQADENVRISRSAVENSQASLRDALALERAGVGTRFDVLRSQVNLANAQQDLTNALSQQVIARRRLAVQLNLPQAANI